MKQADYPIGEVLRYDGTPSSLVLALPHYHLVPKDPKQHLAWRIWLRKKAQDNPEFQAKLWQMCSEDVLFFINAFCWIEEPREGETSAGLIPFNTWVHQDPIIAAVAFYFGKRHIVIDKSRAQGASWLMLCIFLWRFLFFGRQRLGMASLNAELADDADAPESLGWKFDNLWSLLPTWMTRFKDGRSKLKRNYGKSTWRNLENGSTLKAHAATANLGRAGRFTGYFLDESTRFMPGYDRAAVGGLLPTCNGIVMASTPDGFDNEHSDRLDDPQTWLTGILDWKDNPEQNRGLYTTENNALKILNDGYPAGYYPILDGRERSPWFDDICKQHKNNMIFIDQEYNRDRGGSKGRPFKKEIIDRAKATCYPAPASGKLTFDPFDPVDATWIPGGGEWKIWIRLEGHRPPPRKYVFGVDIAAGTGGDQSSNSVISVWDETTGEQVAEFASNQFTPTELAAICCAAAYWFGKGGLPHIVPERNAQGGSNFIRELLGLGYWNIYQQKPGSDERPYAKKGKAYGYHNSAVYIALQPLIQELTRARITPRSAKMLDEAYEYVYDDKGKVVHPKSVSTNDGSAKGINHGDRAIAAALAIRGIKDRGGLKSLLVTQKQPEPWGFKDIHRAPPQTMAGRMRQLEERTDARRKALFK